MPVEIFCCYSRKDQVHLNELKTHLMPLQRQELITLWADTDIDGGMEWENEINKHLNTAQIILLLISPDFIASDYCYSKEMQRAMERHKLAEASVIPIILRPALWQITPFGKLQALPREAKPVFSSNWHNPDEAYLDIAKGIMKVVAKIMQQPLTTANVQTKATYQSIGTRADGNIVIAVVGDSHSGKTQYIAALAYLFQRGMLHQISEFVSLASLTPEKEREYLQDYLQDIQLLELPLPTANKLVKTQVNTAREPLIYSFTFKKSPKDSAQKINLLFYDISAEEIADPSLIVQFGEHVLRADAIIYLIDPLTMPQVLSHLPSHLQPDPSAITGRPAHEVLANIIYRYEQYQRIKQGESIAIPTAITLSKSDLIMYFADMRYYSVIDPRFASELNTENIIATNVVVKSLLSEFGEYPLLNLARTFEKVSFFAISATGSPPELQGKYIRNLPQHCLDPLFWILQQLGIINIA